MVTAGPEEDILIKYAQSDFEKQTGIHASIETVSRDLWPSRAAREFTDDAASYDLVALNSSAGDPVWVARGKSQDLRKLLPADLIDNILPKLREAATYNDKLVAVPQYWNTEMYFYRKDLFADPKNQADFKAKYGYDLAPPTTWDQLADIDEFFYRPTDLYGGWMSGVNWGIGLDYQTILFGVGGRAFDLESNALARQQPGERQDLRDHATHRQDGAGELRHPELLRRRHADARRQARLLHELFVHLGGTRQAARQVRHDGPAGQRHPDRHLLLRGSGVGAECRLAR